MDIELLQERSRIIRHIRSFFDGKGYLELDTPLLSPDLIPESCLEVFETSRILPSGSTSPYWLIPSPEIWMKKIIARHRVNVYQICKCFRNGESSGFLHSPEFTMLEYYTMNADYRDSLKLTEELFQNILTQRHKDTKGCEMPANHAPSSVPRTVEPLVRGSICLRERSLENKSFERLTVAEAFSRFAGFDLFAAAETPGKMETEARKLGLDPPPGMTTPQLYDLIFIHAVEPKLKQDHPIALLDYPAFTPCLARQNADDATVERWELYYNGIELANCFTEETDPQRVRAFFESEAAVKKRQALVKHHIDSDYWKLFANYPPCSGVAMGADRLIMAICGKSTIDGILPFPIA